MKEISDEAFVNMQQAVSLQTEQSFRSDFCFVSRLPQNISFLEILSWNYYWSWIKGGAEVFRDLDPQLWEEFEQNPRLILKNISELRLWQKANDDSFVRKLNILGQNFREYLSQPVKDFGKVTSTNPVAYFCAEYGVHNSLPIYSGGLGILAGDHLKSASDLNVPLVAVGLLYRFGYFRQKIGHDGWQEETYANIFDSELALSPVLNDEGNRVFVMVHMREREVFAQAWLAQVGRISLYLLDTNIPKNHAIDRLVTGHLYGGDSETRVVQEKILGIGGARLLGELGIEPSVYHLNEGHSAFLTLELTRRQLFKHDGLTFDEAASQVREKCVFTTHTPVDAGNDSFSPDLIEDCFDRKFIDSLKLEKKDFFSLGRIDPSDTEEWFGMTPLALRMARSANGVSEKHGEISRKLWHKMFADISEVSDVPITHITNGVHPLTWIAPTFRSLYETQIGENWADLLQNEGSWKTAVDDIPDEKIWKARQSLKCLLIAFIRERTYSKTTGSRQTIHEHDDTRSLFNDNVLTIGFARRIAAYKRWNLLMTDIERLLRMVDDPDRPVQFIFAGKAHPQDRKAKKILQNLMSINNDSNWQNRAVFIEDYDQDVARYLVQGVDVWMNMPRRPHEASGTSGQKAAMNGGLNFSILDGWWIEGFNGRNGFSVGEFHESDDPDDSVNDLRDAESLYQTLENEIIPAYYKMDEHGFPSTWVEFIKNSIATLTPQFSSDRMVKDYIEQIYM